ncbi:MAG: BlaI/MecI/CopY family transcriptional regulator [Bacteroidota bacterium]
MSIKPTESELEILRVLWEKSPGTVREVNDALNEKREVGYTTTLKLMQIMYNKGLLKRERAGKTHRYEPAMPKETTQNALLSRFVENAFGGSTSNLVMQALGNQRTSPEDIEAIRAYLDELENKQ